MDTDFPYTNLPVTHKLHMYGFRSYHANDKRAWWWTFYIAKTATRNKKIVAHYVRAYKMMLSQMILASITVLLYQHRLDVFTCIMSKKKKKEKKRREETNKYKKTSNRSRKWMIEGEHTLNHIKTSIYLQYSLD